MKNKLLPLILASLMILSCSMTSVFADTAKITFSDVDASTQDGAAIYKLAQKGIINGIGDGTFAPQSYVTRAQLCKMINNIWGFTEMATEGFKDVTQDKWYYTYVLAGKKAGYINGFDDGTFKGDNFVTREQACAIICRVAKLSNTAYTQTISDNVSIWAQDYVKAVLANNLMSLEAGNTFRATENMKRVELARVLSSFVDDEKTEVKPEDKTESKPEATPEVKPNTDGNKKPVGGSSGGSGGGNSGGSGGGNSGGSSGGSSSDEPEIDYAEKNKKVVKNLSSVKADFESNRELFTPLERSIVDIVLSVMDDVIDKSDEMIISTKNIYSEYTDQIMEALEIYQGMEEHSKTSFVSKVSQMDSESFSFLEDFFGIDISDVKEKL